MAEDVVGGLIAGLEVEERETEASLGGVDAAAMALAMDAARGDADLSRKAAHHFEGLRRLVDKQDALQGLQLQHFSEEQRAAVAAARRKGFSDRLRNGAQAFLVLVIAAVCLLGLAIIVAAAASRSVVVETFTTPPALAARGIVGQVVATNSRTPPTGLCIS